MTNFDDARVRCPRTVHLRGAALLLAAIALCARPSAAQLRPLDPLDWAMLEGPSVGARLGFGAFDGQRLGLAGTEGRLWEWGNLQLHWRTGRVLLEAGGTVLRTFRDEHRFGPPVDNAGTPQDGRRSDAGDFRVATVVRLTPEHRLPVTLRFGTRLPTTDDRVGIDRDMIDFFALLGAQLGSGPARLGGEVGLGIHGTRYPEFEQVDPLLYTWVAEYRLRRIEPFVALTGQWNGPRDWEVRGNDDLQEWRLGVRAGGRRWIEAAAVFGSAAFSPRRGVLVSAGWRH